MVVIAQVNSWKKTHQGWKKEFSFDVTSAKPSERSLLCIGHATVRIWRSHHRKTGLEVVSEHIASMIQEERSLTSYFTSFESYWLSHVHEFHCMLQHCLEAFKNTIPQTADTKWTISCFSFRVTLNSSLDDLAAYLRFMFSFLYSSFVLFVVVFLFFSFASRFLWIKVSALSSKSDYVIMHSVLYEPGHRNFGRKKSLVIGETVLRSLPHTVVTALELENMILVWWYSKEGKGVKIKYSFF